MISNKKTDIIYEFILTFKKSHDGNSPTIREIKEYCDISTTSLVEYYIEQLVEEGRIILSEEMGSRRIMVPGGEWNLSKEMTAVNPSGHCQSSKGDD